MEFKVLLKNWFREKVAPWLTYTAVRLWFSTVRVKILNPSVYRDHFLRPGNDRNVVAGSWHRHAIFFFYRTFHSLTWKNSGNRPVLYLTR